MTKLEAEQKAQDWQNLNDDANCEAENGCFGAAERILNQARSIEEELKSAGYDVLQLLRGTQSRRRRR